MLWKGLFPFALKATETEAEHLELSSESTAAKSPEISPFTPPTLLWTWGKSQSFSAFFLFPHLWTGCTSIPVFLTLSASQQHFRPEDRRKRQMLIIRVGEGRNCIHWRVNLLGMLAFSSNFLTLFSYLLPITLLKQNLKGNSRSQIKRLGLHVGETVLESQSHTFTIFLHL